MRNYWSCSKFARWVQVKFANVNKPHALPLGEWDNWNDKLKSEHPFVFWFTEEFLDDVQGVLVWPSERLNDIRSYVKNRFFDKLHYLPTRLTPGQYYDVDTRLLHGMFETLIDFIEVEKAWMMVVFGTEEDRKKYPGLYRPWYLRWKGFRCPEAGLDHLKWEMTLDTEEVDEHGTPLGHPPQAMKAKEQFELYNWWKKRLQRPDAYEFAGYNEFNDQMESIYGETGIFGRDKTWSTEHQAKMIKILKDVQKLEEKWAKEDEEMMIRLVKIRQSLWT
jgi:hypothetical protein